MLSRKDVFIIRHRKPDCTNIELIHRQTNIRVNTSSADGDFHSEDARIAEALDILSHKVANRYR